ncbi:unnamed protein product [Adineta ricciae]|uniref:Uncharacterized protein n=1 Tax=Adineta ricciae TaxID=249248 RepID=A0A814XC11_ADIRI|nr:unnamed protein product [Adineta ricciae]CAF1209217.1 unnamed protein product [Adineta ricciae]
MINEKVLNGNSDCCLSQKSSASEEQVQNKNPFQSLETTNVKHPLAGLNYLSFLRSILFDYTYRDAMNPLSTNSSNLLDEPIVLRLNIPIEMIVRSIPQQISSSQDQYNRRCSCPTQIASEMISKPPISFMRRAQEIFFGNNMKNDREDIASKSYIVPNNMPTFNSHLINETNRSAITQQQQQAKVYQKPSQITSCSRRCECH